MKKAVNQFVGLGILLLMGALFPFALHANTATIAVQTPVSYQVIQRDGNNQADIRIAGTYTGVPTAIEARFNNGQWTVITANPNNGIYQGTLEKQIAGQGTLEVRFSNNPTVVTSIQFVGIGDIFAIAGQSNATGAGTTGMPSQSPLYKVSQYKGTWSEVDLSKSFWSVIAVRFMADQHVPIAFITDTPLGATSIEQWQKGGNLYGKLAVRIQEVGKVKAILFWQGEGNAGGLTSREQYTTLLNNFVNAAAADFNVKTVIAQIGEVKIYNVYGNEGFNNVRLAQATVWDTNPNALFGPVLYDVRLNEGVHFLLPSEIQIAGNRWWAALKSHFYGGSDGRGPRFVSAQLLENRVAIAVKFSDSSLPVTAGFGFQVKDNGVLVPIKNVVGTNSDTIVIELQQPIKGKATISLGDGSSATGVAVPKDSSEFRLPAEIFINKEVINTPVITPSPTPAVLLAQTQQPSPTLSSSPSPSTTPTPSSIPADTQVHKDEKKVVSKTVPVQTVSPRKDNSTPSQVKGATYTASAQTVAVPVTARTGMVWYLSLLPTLLGASGLFLSIRKLI